MKLTVLHCVEPWVKDKERHNCPFAHFEPDTCEFFCVVSDNRDVPWNAEKLIPPPNWCPLRSGNVELELLLIVEE